MDTADRRPLLGEYEDILERCNNALRNLEVATTRVCSFILGPVPEEPMLQEQTVSESWLRNTISNLENLCWRLEQLFVQISRFQNEGFKDK